MLDGAERTLVADSPANFRRIAVGLQKNFAPCIGRIRLVCYIGRREVHKLLANTFAKSVHTTIVFLGKALVVTSFAQPVLPSAAEKFVAKSELDA